MTSPEAERDMWKGFAELLLNENSELRNILSDLQKQGVKVEIPAPTMEMHRIMPV